MPRVALVFPYFRTRSLTEMLFPPLGIATLAGQLRKLGVETRVFDATFATFEALRADLLSYEPDIVGISAMVSLTGNTLRVAEMVRSSLPSSLLVDSYGGLFVPNHGLQVDNPTVHYSESELQSFPLPDRSDFDHAAYQDVWLRATGSKVTSILATLGCPFGCDFCSKPVFGNVFRRRGLDAVFAEIEQIRDLGYDGLWIADDTFTMSLPHLHEFCRRMAGRQIGWHRYSTIEQVVAGLHRIAGGLEPLGDLAFGDGLAELRHRDVHVFNPSFVITGPPRSGVIQ